MNKYKFTLIAAIAVLSSGCTTILPVSSNPAKAEADSLHVAVQARNAEGKSDGLSTAAAAAVRKVLAEKGFMVEDTDAPDVRVTLDVAHREVNRAGDFILMEGVACARATVPARDNRVIGEETVKAQGKRALGENAALDGVSTALVPRIEDWTRRTVSAKAVGVSAQTIVVSYADARTKDIPKFKTSFVHAVLSTPGVRSCVLVSEAAVPPTATYRVVYDDGSFPAGLVNEIAVGHPELRLRPGAPF